MRILMLTFALLASNSDAILRKTMNLNSIYVGRNLDVTLKELKIKGFSITRSNMSVRLSSSTQFMIISCNTKGCQGNSKVDSVYLEIIEDDRLNCISTYKSNSKAFGPPRVGLVNKNRIAIWRNGNINLSLQCKKGFTESNLYVSGDVYFGNIHWIEQGSFNK